MDDDEIKIDNFRKLVEEKIEELTLFKRIKAEKMDRTFSAVAQLSKNGIGRRKIIKWINTEMYKHNSDYVYLPEKVIRDIIKLVRNQENETIIESEKSRVMIYPVIDLCKRSWYWYYCAKKCGIF
jgi:hypothetical protein